jgi:hypothetical protein
MRSVSARSEARFSPGRCGFDRNGLSELARDRVCGFGNPWKRKPYLDSNALKEYQDGVKYGS